MIPVRHPVLDCVFLSGVVAASPPAAPARREDVGDEVVLVGLPAVLLGDELADLVVVQIELVGVPVWVGRSGWVSVREWVSAGVGVKGGGAMGQSLSAYCTIIICVIVLNEVLRTKYYGTSPNMGLAFSMAYCSIIVCVGPSMQR